MQIDFYFGIVAFLSIMSTNCHIFIIIKKKHYYILLMSLVKTGPKCFISLL